VWKYLLNSSSTSGGGDNNKCPNQSEFFRGAVRIETAPAPISRQHPSNLFPNSIELSNHFNPSLPLSLSLSLSFSLNDFYSLFDYHYIISLSLSLSSLEVAGTLNSCSVADQLLTSTILEKIKRKKTNMKA